MSASRGRPKSENSKSDRLFVRVTPEEKEYISEFCKKEGVTISDLVKTGINATIRERSTKIPSLSAMAKRPTKLSDHTKK